MNEKIVTAGVCNKCKKIITKNSARSHINKCFGLREVETVDAFLIKVQWPHKNPIYWIYFATPFKFTLEDIDNFLRETWLECCDHLSQFTISGKRYCCNLERDYVLNPYLSFEELSMSIPIEKVLTLGLKFIHEYDFGSTTELLLEVVGLIKTEFPKKINVMIRNQEPEFDCVECGEKAVLICSNDDEEFLCISCAEDDEYLLPLVNSPRTGVCGYAG
jgi:hypothetical protein